MKKDLTIELMTEGLKALKIYNAACVTALVLTGVAMAATIVPVVKTAIDEAKEKSAETSSEDEDEEDEEENSTEQAETETTNATAE